MVTPLISTERLQAVEFTPEQLQRYARHLSIPDVGVEGQKRLRAASVLCIGAGGLGSPIALYLAAAGIGRLGLVDPDVVDFSNLQRQILHGTEHVGVSKLESAAGRLRSINPDVEVACHPVAFTSGNAMDLAADYDIIIDGTDNFPTRYLSNDVAVFQRKPNVYGSIFRFEGQCSVFAPHLGGPCYRCMFPEPPEPGMVPSCAEGGVLGVLPGIIGSLQALEAIKLILHRGDSLTGRLMHFDALAFRFREFKLRRDPDCPVCGENPSITEPIDYETFCDVPRAGDSAEPTVPEVTVHELRSRQQAGEALSVIDVRETYEYDIAHIPDSTLIPLKELPERLAEVPRDVPVFVHCKGGGRSARAVALLRDAGYSNVWNVEGGIDAWSREIDSKVPSY